MKVSEKLKKISAIVELIEIDFKIESYSIKSEYQINIYFEPKIKPIGVKK